jgi:hypothetical protein
VIDNGFVDTLISHNGHGVASAELLLHGIRSFINQHYGDTIHDGIDSSALLAAEAMFIGNVVQVAFALRTAQKVEQFFIHRRRHDCLNSSPNT